MSLTVKDLEKLQSQSDGDYRLELVDGKIIVMSPSGYESDQVAARVIGKLFPYVDENRLGRVTASSAGFVLPNPNTRAQQRWVEIRRSGQNPVTLIDGDMLSVPDLLPSWEVAVSDLWSPVFDEE